MDSVFPESGCQTQTKNISTLCYCGPWGKDKVWIGPWSQLRWDGDMKTICLIRIRLIILSQQTHHEGNCHNGVTTITMASCKHHCWSSYNLEMTGRNRVKSEPANYLICDKHFSLQILGSGPRQQNALAQDTRDFLLTNIFQLQIFFSELWDETDSSQGPRAAGAQQVKTENCRDSWLTFWLLSHLSPDTSSSSPWFYSNECGG